MLITKYFTLNLSHEISPTNTIILRDIAILVFLLLYYGMIISVLQISFGLKDKKIPTKYKNWITIGIGVIVLCYVIKILLPQKSSSLTWLNIILGFAIANLFFLDFKFPIGMIKFANKNPDKNEAKISKAFGYLYISRYIVATVIFMIQGIIFWWKIPEPIQPFIAFVILAYFNLIPFIWLKYYFINYAKSITKVVSPETDLKSVYKKYNISKREQEILTLIMDGKNNKEIEETLFISYHTVKNHVYNIFQKFGVKNRFELIHLITKYQS